tara:strand:+ start:1617 stop:2261 length:645 start_codon:yes stop_codon:yes gene_type:complete
MTTESNESQASELGCTSIHVRRAREGDDEAIRWLVDRFTPALMASARYRLGNHLRRHYEPEDLVQDVWCVALTRLHELVPRESRYTPVLLRFLASIMWRAHANLLRKHVRGKPLLVERNVTGSQILDRISASNTGVVERAVRSEQTTRLLQALDRLKPTSRTIVILRGLEQVPNHEAAVLLGEPEKTVAARYQRALAQLRELVPGSLMEDLPGD